MRRLLTLALLATLASPALALRYLECFPSAASCNRFPIPASADDPPSSCRQGDLYLKMTAGAGNCTTTVNRTVCVCTQDGTWFPLDAAVAVSPTTTALITILQNEGFLAQGSYTGSIATGGNMTAGAFTASPATGNITGNLLGVKDGNTSPADMTVSVRTTDSGSISATGDITTVTLGGAVTAPRVFDVTSSGVITWTSNTQRYEITLGGAVVCDSGVYTPATGNVYNFHATITVQSGQNPATVRCAGTFTFGAPNAAIAAVANYINVNSNTASAVLTGTPILKSNVIIVATNSLVENNFVVRELD